MTDCTYCWARYMQAVALSKKVQDPMKRRTLIRTAYQWLDRYFEAEDRAVARFERFMEARSRVR